MVPSVREIPFAVADRDRFGLALVDGAFDDVAGLVRRLVEGRWASTLAAAATSAGDLVGPVRDPSIRRSASTAANESCRWRAVTTRASGRRRVSAAM